MSLTQSSDRETTPMPLAKGEEAVNIIDDVASLATDLQSEDESDAGPQIPMLSEKRQAQSVIFDAWFVHMFVPLAQYRSQSIRRTQRAATITKAEVQAVVRDADEETLSIRALMSKHASNNIIDDPREYQLELFEKAKQQNIIAVLDTGW